MNRYLALISLLTFVAPFAFAQRPAKGPRTIETTVHVAYISIRNEDGSYTTVRDFDLPAKITPISAATKNPFRIKTKSQSTAGLIASLDPLLPLKSAMTNITVFQNDQPSAQFVVGETVQSALDDLVFDTGAVDKAWKIVRTGVHLSTPNRTGKFLIRWRAYKQFVPGLGPGVQAFINEMFDVGFYLNRSQFPPTDSTYMVDIDFTQSPLMILSQETCFLAQQFREPQTPVENGEGAFTTEWNVFCDNGPQVGTSDDIFFFDLEPNGIYDEQEADQFEVPGAANFLFKVDVSSAATQTLTPVNFQWVRGSLVSGGLSALWFDNGLYMVGRAGSVPSVAEPPAQLVVETFSPYASPGGLRFDVDSKVNTPGLAIRLELWNWFTNSYTQIYQGPATMTDSRVSGVVQFPFLYVDEDSTMRAKVSWVRTGPTLMFPWTVSVDQTVWTVTADN